MMPTGAAAAALRAAAVAVAELAPPPQRRPCQPSLAAGMLKVQTALDGAAAVAGQLKLLLAQVI